MFFGSPEERWHVNRRLGVELVIPMYFMFWRSLHSSFGQLRAIDNLAYNERTITYFKCNKILKLSDPNKLQVMNYIFQLLQFNIDNEIEPNLLVNHQIHNNNTRSNNKIDILRVKKQV